MKTLLIVDDDTSTRHVLKDVLEAEGYKILEAEDGRQALEIIHSHPVHLVITDRAMPVMGGLEFLQKLQERKLNIPALMISAYGEEKLWGQALSLGAHDYILKPFNMKDVVKLVKKVLAGGKR